METRLLPVFPDQADRQLHQGAQQGHLGTGLTVKGSGQAHLSALGPGSKVRAGGKEVAGEDIPGLAQPVLQTLLRQLRELPQQGQDGVPAPRLTLFGVQPPGQKSLLQAADQPGGFAPKRDFCKGVPGGSRLPLPFLRGQAQPTQGGHQLYQQPDPCPHPGNHHRKGNTKQEDPSQLIHAFLPLPP
jgi:hypothetical protein